jgi:hypothetical protein
MGDDDSAGTPNSLCARASAPRGRARTHTAIDPRGAQELRRVLIPLRRGKHRPRHRIDDRLLVADFGEEAPQRVSVEAVIGDHFVDEDRHLRAIGVARGSRRRRRRVRRCRSEERRKHETARYRSRERCLLRNRRHGRQLSSGAPRLSDGGCAGGPRRACVGFSCGVQRSMRYNLSVAAVQARSGDGNEPASPAPT